MENTQTAKGEDLLLTTRDWSKEWRDLQKARRASDDSNFWDKKAESFGKPFGHSGYTDQFLEFTGIRPGENVFDMGCGTGALAIPLAEDGHDVVAADFSQGMLGRLIEEKEARGIENITEVRLSWDDDWEDAGVFPDSADVAVASRSIATLDLKGALGKLTTVARRRCAVTLSAGSSPRSDQQILSEIGLQKYIGRDFLYAFMILADMGFYPEVKYIESTRRDSYDGEEDAYASLAKMVTDVSHMVPEEYVTDSLARLKTWVSANLVPNKLVGRTNEYGEIEKGFILRRPRKITWAHISWDVES